MTSYRKMVVWVENVHVSLLILHAQKCKFVVEISSTLVCDISMNTITQTTIRSCCVGLTFSFNKLFQNSCVHFFWSGIIRHPSLWTQSMGMVQVVILKPDLHTRERKHHFVRLTLCVNYLDLKNQQAHYKITWCPDVYRCLLMNCKKTYSA